MLISYGSFLKHMLKKGKREKYQTATKIVCGNQTLIIRCLALNKHSIVQQEIFCIKWKNIQTNI